jgi:hypothetical protein
MVFSRSLDKNEEYRPERSEGSLRWLRDSHLHLRAVQVSVAANMLPQRDINRTLEKPCAYLEFGFASPHFYVKIKNWLKFDMELL